MKVHVVTCGEINSGGRVVGVFSNLLDAYDAAIETETLFAGGWIKAKPDQWPNNSTVWINAFDYVMVQTHEVK